ncbi:MAG: ABC transporter permease [Candidatus Howiella sp.]|jgi:ABC-type uncharacterized transport system permease subunit
MQTIINFLYYSVRAGTPLLFGTTGEIVTEKSGSLNLGVEGMMAMGAIFGYYFACLSGSLTVGLLAAFIAAGLGGLIFAFLTVTMQANQNVTGLALTTFGVGVCRFFGTSMMTDGTFPSLSANPHLAAAVADTGIPVLRDIPYLGKLLFSYNIFVYLGIVMAVILFVYIAKTRTGLRMRAIGENPAAADACGVNVNLTKYLNITLGAGICGIGGLYMAFVTNGGAWNDNWINGAGWISVALVIFSSWNPVKAILGSFFFGMLQALQPWKGNLANEFPSLLSWLGNIPDEFYQLLPFLITAIVLTISSIRNKKEGRQPAYCGINYFREER